MESKILDTIRRVRRKLSLQILWECVLWRSCIAGGLAVLFLLVTFILPMKLSRELYLLVYLAEEIAVGIILLGVFIGIIEGLIKRPTLQEAAARADRTGLQEHLVTALERMLNQEMGLFGIIDRHKYPQICALARKLVWEVYEPQPERVYREEYYSACYYMLMAELRQESASLEKITARQAKQMEEIAPALMAVKQAVDQGSLPEVSGLAVLCDMSTSNFRRRFKAAVGVAPKDYITACCIHRACRLLLRTDEKIINIASQCGFLNVSGFNRCFLKFTGISPREYRRRNA